ncbi:MAG TPA: hypothetical protein DG753_03840 [Clostridium sp.]|nr:hypothetical protein [Clostridium sp.]
MVREDKIIKLYFEDDRCIFISDEIKVYDEEAYGSICENNIRRALTSMSSIDIEDGKVWFTLEKPNSSDLQLSKYKIDYSITRVKLLKYNNEANDYIVIQSPIYTANRYNGLVKYVFGNRFKYNEDILMDFARGLILLLNDSEAVQDIVDGKVSRRTKRLGCLFNSIRWDEYDAELKPEYKVWDEGLGSISITEDDLNKWKNSEPYDL